MTAFSAALAMLIKDPNLGLAITFLPAAGAPVACNGVFAQPDDDITLGQFRVRDRKRPLIVRAADIAQPARGDMVMIGNDTYRVMDASQPDPQRLTWRLELATQT